MFLDFVRFFKHYKTCYKAHRHEKEAERYKERGPRRKAQRSAENAVDDPVEEEPGDISSKRKDKKIDIYVSDLTGEVRCVSISIALGKQPQLKFKSLFSGSEGRAN